MQVCQNYHQMFQVEDYGNMMVHNGHKTATKYWHVLVSQELLFTYTWVYKTYTYAMLHKTRQYRSGSGSVTYINSS